MTPQPTPPAEPQKDPQAVQLAKLIIGGILTLALIGAVAFSKRLGLEDTVTLGLLAGIVGTGAVTVHGAFKMQPGGGQ